MGSMFTFVLWISSVLDLYGLFCFVSSSVFMHD